MAHEAEAFFRHWLEKHAQELPNRLRSIQVPIAFYVGKRPTGHWSTFYLTFDLKAATPHEAEEEARALIEYLEYGTADFGQSYCTVGGHRDFTQDLG